MQQAVFETVAATCKLIEPHYHPKAELYLRFRNNASAQQFCPRLLGYQALPSCQYNESTWQKYRNRQDGGNFDSPILAFLSTSAWLSNWIQYFFVWLAFQGPSRCLQNVPLFDPPIIYRHLQIGLNFQTWRISEFLWISSWTMTAKNVLNSFDWRLDKLIDIERLLSSLKLYDVCQTSSNFINNLQ